MTPANVVLAKPCSFGPAGCPADRVPCVKCKTLCWLSHGTKQDAEDLKEPYVVMCYGCCVEEIKPKEIYVGERTLADALRAIGVIGVEPPN